MRLISLDLENFLKFERLALEFPDGLTGVLGPNGVGKSSWSKRSLGALRLARQPHPK